MWFTVSDGELTSVGSTTAQIVGANDLPNAQDNVGLTDSTYAIAALDVLANDSDIENDLLTVTEVEATTIAVGTPVGLASGAIVTLNANGTLGYDPNGAFASGMLPTTDTFAYTVSDGTDVTTAQRRDHDHRTEYGSTAGRRHGWARRGCHAVCGRSGGARQ